MNVSPLLLTLSDFPLIISMNHSDKNLRWKRPIRTSSLSPLNTGLSQTIPIQSSSRVCVFISATSHGHLLRSLYKDYRICSLP